MPPKGPHISIESASLVPRILKVGEREFANWPEAVRQLAVDIASELFLVRYNPFIDERTVEKSVRERFEQARRALDHHYATAIGEGITMFWSAHSSDMAFRKELISRLQSILPSRDIDTRNSSLIDNSTDSTDMRLELPILVITPSTVEQVQAVVRLADEMQFAIIPRGGGSGSTGGAIPARKRSVVMAMTKFTHIGEVDEENMTLTVQSGVHTINAIKAADAKGLLFSTDPASKTASTIGGNVAENAGGPLCFEYGTCIDNLFSYRLVDAQGELLEVSRKDHPRSKILPDQTTYWEVRDEKKRLIKTVEIHGPVLRTPGLGKDVTNKALEGLPGMQKEGTDGIIIDATFILHPKLKLFRVMVLEFFGRSMENSMLVINDIVALRNDIRSRGDLVKITALEEFNAKYVKAIGYTKKSEVYEGDPISVLILQLDSNDAAALEEAVQNIVGICQSYDGVDAFVAQNEKEAELFWEDRHKLSAIAKRTSGFKINEDVVIPMKAIPAYALYLETLNLEYMGRAYREALRRAEKLKGLSENPRISEEMAFAAKVIQGAIPTTDLSDEELQLHAVLFLNSLSEERPEHAESINAIIQHMESTVISVASHMHAGDGNWHVNIPVNSNDPAMLHHAEKVAHLVMAKAQELGGAVTGEHGIGITKIAFFKDDQMTQFLKYKQEADPRNIFNPAKLTQRELPEAPFTFSFNRLIEDLRQSGIANKSVLINLLSNIQVCTRCGKCKLNCPMHYPEQSMLYHPRNKNLVLGALIEAIYYSQVNDGKPDPHLFHELRELVEFCTGCGKCLQVCPVKINSAEVALDLRGFLEEQGAGGHPIKHLALSFLAGSPSKRVPLIGKVASLGQGVQNKFLKAVPKKLREKISYPMFSGPGPVTGVTNTTEHLKLGKGSIFIPEGEVKGTVFYFIGCGGGVFYYQISLAGIVLLLKAGYAVVLPEKHLCCGFPVLASGGQKMYAKNLEANQVEMRRLAEKAKNLGLPVTHVATACGSCKSSLARHQLDTIFPKVDGKPVTQTDVGHLVLTGLEPFGPEGKPVVYHAPCHTEVPGMHKIKAAGIYSKNIGKHLNAKVSVSPGCCSESGAGAMTQPNVYNRLRSKKAMQLEKDLAGFADDAPVIVTCPSCRMGLTRIFLNEQGNKHSAVHLLEYLAERHGGPKWRRAFSRLLNSPAMENGARKIKMTSLAGLAASEPVEVE